MEKGRQTLPRYLRGGCLLRVQKMKHIEKLSKHYGNMFVQKKQIGFRKFRTPRQFRNLDNMLWERQATWAKCKPATISTSDPDDPPLPPTACVRTSVPQTATLQKKKFSVGDTPACSTANNVSTWCLFCCDAADEVRARPGSVGRWRPSPGAEILLDMMTRRLLDHTRTGCLSVLFRMSEDLFCVFFFFFINIFSKTSLFGNVDLFLCLLHIDDRPTSQSKVFWDVDTVAVKHVHYVSKLSVRVPVKIVFVRVEFSRVRVKVIRVRVELESAERYVWREQEKERHTRKRRYQDEHP